MASYTGAEIIIEYLVREGVPYLFGLCGHGILGFLDAAYAYRDRIKVISVHHEAAAAFMADAFFRVAHRPVATFSSCGPGSVNLLLGLASAFMDSSAFLAITGNVPTCQFNRGPFQETGRHFQADFPSVVRHYVKRSFQATRPEQLPLMVRQAFAVMLQGRPGPVNLDVPLDVFVERAEVEIPEPGLWRHGISCRSGGEPEAIERALDLLISAERPLMVAGHGVELAEAAAELATLAEALQVPVATTPAGKGVFDPRSPLWLGETGRNGTYPANQAARTADVILALGTRFDDRAASSWLPGYTYAIPPTKLIHVDIDPQELGRNYPVSVGILGDVRTVLRQLYEAALRRGVAGRLDRRPWLERVGGWRRKWEAYLAEYRHSEAVPIRPERLLADLRSVLPEEAIVLADVGVHHNWVVQCWPAFRPRTLLQSWGFAAMGFGVCGALGAKLAAPDRPVVAVVGDGGFLMFPGVVATAVEYDIPVVWVVWNNYGYCSIRDQQLGYFGPGRELATSFLREATGELFSVDFAGLARSMGAEGLLVERPSDLKPALEAALRSERPWVLDVRVDREAKPPATASWQLPPLPPPAPDPAWFGEG